MVSVKFKRADAHAFVRTLQSGSIDLIYSDPPFGTTKNAWDNSMDWEFLFVEFKRILRPNGIIVLHSAMPFTYDLICVERPRYHYVWVKERPTNFFNVKTQPMRRHEEVLVWVNTVPNINNNNNNNSSPPPHRPPTYNPQMSGSAWKATSYTTSAEYYNLHRMKGEYRNHLQSSASGKGHRGSFPDSVLNYKRQISGFSTRPRCMVDYILRTYSNEGDTVLDISCYNGLTGICAKLLHRNYMGVDIQHISRRGVRQLHRSILQGGGGGDVGYLRERLQQFYDASPEHASTFLTLTGNTGGKKRTRTNRRQ